MYSNFRFRLIVLSCLSVGGTLLLASCASKNPTQITPLPQEAVPHHAQGQDNNAESLLKEAGALLSAIVPTHERKELMRLSGQAARHQAQGQYAEAESLLQEALAMLEKAPDTTSSEKATLHSHFGALYFAQGNYHQAEAHYQQALSFWRTAPATRPKNLATVHHNLGTVYFAQGKYQDAEAHQQQALTLLEPSAPASADMARFLNNLAELYTTQERYDEAEVAYQRALSIREANPEDTARSLNGLGGLAYRQGRYPEAQIWHQKALTVLEQHVDAQHPDIGTTYDKLATVHYAQAHYHDAEILYNRARVLLERTLGSDHPQVAFTLLHVATLSYTQRKFAQAERLYHRALAILRLKVEPTHPAVVRALHDLAMITQEQGEHHIALGLLAQVEEQMQGATAAERATLFAERGRLYQQQEQYEEAKRLFAKALTLREQTLPPMHPTIAVSLHDLADLARVQGAYEEAEPLYNRALTIRQQALGPDHPDVAADLLGLAALSMAQRHYAEAAAHCRQALTVVEKSLGRHHPDVALILSHLATAFVAQNQVAQALPLYERARRILLDEARLHVDLDDATRRHLLQRGRTVLQGYAALLTRLASQSSPSHTDVSEAVREAFVVVEQLRGGVVQAALSQAGARSVAKHPATAQLAQQAQVLRDRRRTVYTGLTTAYASPADRRDPTHLQQLMEMMSDIDRRLATATDQLYTSFPQYAELIAPLPIDIATLSQLLHPDEALVSFFMLGQELLVWLVRPGMAPVFRVIRISRTELVNRVTTVRTSLDQSQNPLLYTSGQLLPLDVAGAHELYTLLLAPLRPALAGVQHLLVVPDEALFPLPFGALVTQAESTAYQILAQRYSQAPHLPLAAHELLAYANLAWLIHDYALTVLPSATSLRALRSYARSTGTARHRLIGFGDPMLQGHGPQRGGSMVVGLGPNVPLDSIRKMPSLPGTRKELWQLATALGADPQTALYLHERATESMLRTLNRDGQLATTQVLAFATHGLIGGEMTGVTQPALVLTPPATPSQYDDGLLSLEEILALNLLHTHWVVLSACNTAAADGSGEGVSGLARAFLFAGTQAVLVSLWSVDDKATQELMSSLFHHYASNHTPMRSEALRQGILALQSQASGNQAYFAHPFAWAAFFLVGEGTR